MSVQQPKVTILGSGSLFFGRQAIWQMVHSEHLRGGTLALVDIDPEREQKMAALARKVAKHEGVPLKIESSTDRREVLKGSDFVVLSFARRTVDYRGMDCAVSEKYGIRMCSGDTIGPGGIFRAMRELPVIMDVCRDIKELCPDAWVVNYINPTSVMGIALRRYAPQLKTFALCDTLRMPSFKARYAVRAGLIERVEDFSPEIDAKYDFRCAGPNHFTWCLKAEYEGRDVMPAIAESIRQLAATESDGGDVGAKSVHNNAIGYALYDVFGSVPVCVGHTKEYVRYWQGLGRTPEPIPPLRIWETAPRHERHANMWRQVDDFLSGATPIADYMKTFGPDPATDVIEAMWGGVDQPFYVNTWNGGAVTNMEDDDFLELLCDVDMDGPHPRPVGRVPFGLRGLWAQVLDTHELTAEAIVTGRRDILRRAMLTDPLANSIADTDAIIEELLDAERDALPEHWFAAETPDPQLFIQ